MPPDIVKLIAQRKALIGMVHVAALPGTPRHDAPVGEIVRRAVAEAKLLADAGFDALIIENMHDVPYLRREVGPEIIAAMTAVACAVRDAVDIPLGVQILAGANRAALAVAQSSGGQFIRAEGFVFASVADEGIFDEADAGLLLRYRRVIGAEQVRIFADVKKKHSSHAITADVSLAAGAKAAAFFGADGIIITGAATGEPTSIDDLKAVKVALPGVPVIVGSGVTAETAPALLEHADALIVGSSIKKGGVWSEPIDKQRASALVKVINSLR